MSSATCRPREELGDSSQRHRTIDRRGQPVNQPDGQQLLGRVDEAVGEGHESEEGRADQQPDAASATIGQDAEERFEEEPGHGGDGDDHAEEGARCAQPRGEDRQQRRLAHLIGGSGQEVRQHEIKEGFATAHGLHFHLDSAAGLNSAYFTRFVRRLTILVAAAL